MFYLLFVINCCNCLKLFLMDFIFLLVFRTETPSNYHHGKLQPNQSHLKVVVIIINLLINEKKNSFHWHETTFSRQSFRKHFKLLFVFYFQTKNSTHSKKKRTKQSIYAYNIWNTWVELKICSLFYGVISDIDA